ncbi:hypothetical protein GMB34_11260 [Turicibacter sanguinis]|nr:hypothetical protein [Turicibacter sanguinis]MTO01915.1 hypothetical protein [Turicibacter sanguinis]MTO93377.1 hypothetical protein [Turicibacter sanguinis]MTQ10490.1 hypothetical protein [Turicibacter sanguinis]
MSEANTPQLPGINSRYLVEVIFNNFLEELRLEAIDNPALNISNPRLLGLKY